MRLPLYVTLLSALIALVLSAPSVPLRGSLSSSQLGNSRSAPAPAPAPASTTTSGADTDTDAGSDSSRAEGEVDQTTVEGGSGKGEDSGAGVNTGSGVSDATEPSDGQNTSVGAQAPSSSAASSSTQNGGNGHGQTGAVGGVTVTGDAAHSSGSENTHDEQHTSHSTNTEASGTPAGDSEQETTGTGTGEATGEEGNEETDNTTQAAPGTGSQGSSGTQDGAENSGQEDGSGGDGGAGGAGAGAGGAGAGGAGAGAGGAGGNDGNDGNDGSSTAPVVCGEKFVVWFSDGVPVTTVSCGKYTGIYYPSADGNPGPKYISGEVTAVVVEEGKIKVNNQELSTISVTPNENTGDDSVSAAAASKGTDKSAKSRSRRSLQQGTENQTTEVVDVYSFTAGGKTFSVKLPNEKEAEKRNKYFLADDGGDVIFEGNKKEEFHFDGEGDLLDSEGKVILESGDSSSAFDLKYIIPSISAFVLSILLF
uniref:60 kDa glycoprotein n=2 Tax=Cryptosporidium xiaoi TaxID=659607 RepID=A0A8F5HRR6_9CRYT|nr:60 kDa glycoprotein [Cryptosporidium xiaoi]